MIGLNIKLPCRIQFIGPSESGKTYQLVQMIDNGCWGCQRFLDIRVYATSGISINQPCWKAMQRRGYNVTTEILDMTTKQPKFNGNQTRLVIFDDCDNLSQLPKWVVRFMTQDSHHSNISVIIISHKLKTNSPDVRFSSQYVVVFDLPRCILKDIATETKCCADELVSLLSREDGLIKTNMGGYLNNNYVVINHRYYNENKALHRYYRLPKFDEFYDLIEI